MARQEFPIKAPGKAAQLFPLVFGGVLPLFIGAALFFAGSSRHDWLRVLPAVLVMPVVGACLAWSMNRKRVVLEDGRLTLRRFPFPKRLAVADVDLAQARIVDLDSERDLQPSMKISGSGLPGYRVGWFRLRGGRSAWLALTDWRRVLVLPKRDGGIVLLSAERPDALLDALRRSGG